MEIELPVHKAVRFDLPVFVEEKKIGFVTVVASSAEVLDALGDNDETVLAIAFLIEDRVRQNQQMEGKSHHGVVAVAVAS